MSKSLIILLCAIALGITLGMITHSVIPSLLAASLFVVGATTLFITVVYKSWKSAAQGIAWGILWGLITKPLWHDPLAETLTWAFTAMTGWLLPELHRLELKSKSKQ